MLESSKQAAVVALLGALSVWGLGIGPASRAVERNSAEVARIRHHLEGAEVVLDQRNLATLTITQRAARARRIADLRAYRERGVFPHNHRLGGRRTPVFVDEHGTRCAMAYLIERSGGAMLVARIAAMRNLARIRDLANEPGLVAWLDRNGLTLAEAARIQPDYGETGDPVEETVNWAPPMAGAGFSTLGLGLNLSTSASQDGRNLRGVSGILFGGVGAGLGVYALSEDGGAQALGALDVILGVVSIGLGIRQLRGGEGSPASMGVVTPTLRMDRDGTRRVGVTSRF